MQEGSDTKFVVFLDSLGPNDIQRAPWMADNIFDGGTMDAGVPFVTPKVMGEIYTGENPAVHGMPAVSRYDQPNRSRPAVPTLPEIVAADDTYEKVCNFGLPFIVPADVDETGTYWHSSDAMSRDSVYPPNARPHLHCPGPAGNLANPDEDDDVLFNLRVDYTRQIFSTARSLAESQNFDVMFISYRILDSYCHYRYDRVPEGEETSDRTEMLMNAVDPEIADLAEYGDVFVFGDHGARKLTEVFRINHWLRDNGYLDFEIDWDFIEQGRDYGIFDGPSDEQPGEVIQFGAPGVTVDESASVAVSDDPFSTGVTLLDGADEESVGALVSDLEATDAITSVKVARDMWDGPLIDECPDLYPERAPGVFVSGNLAPEKGGPELTRSGVHDTIGAFGATTDLDIPDGHVEPTDIFDTILHQFLGIEEPTGVGGGGDYTHEDDAAAKQRLQDLGYI